MASVPITTASSSSPEKNSIMISSACSMTWLLVTMKPSSEITKPEPSALLRRCGRSPPPRSWRSMKSLKKSSRGDPSGTRGRGPAGPATLVAVVMLTTEGLTSSARSANVPGRDCASEAMLEANNRLKPVSNATVPRQSTVFEFCKSRIGASTRIFEVTLGFLLESVTGRSVTKIFARCCLVSR